MNLGSADLSRAARSLESVQGNVAGQTMAVNMLASQTQQAVGGLAVQMNMLATQLNSLNSSISRLGGGMQMAAPPVMPMNLQPPPSYGGGGGGGYGGGGFAMPQVPIGAMAGATFRGGMTGLGATHGFGSFFGRAGASGVNPFIGTGVTRTGYGAELDPSAGMFRSAIVGTGMGVTPGMMRQMHGGRVMDAGVERAASGFGNAMSATAAGGSALLTSIAGDALGSSMLGPAMGFARGGLAAGMVGGMAGQAMLAPVTMAIGETVRQSGVINQFGDQYRKNAFRFQGGGGATSRSDRVGFGSEMNKLAINDATFTEQDIQEIFGGAVQQDLMRGAGNAADVARRMRELTRTVKDIGRTMGTTVRETLANMSDMQAAGIDPSQAARMAVIGSSIRGMTSGEGVSASMRQASRMSGMGLGAEGFGLGAMSANIAQNAIGSGRLRARDVAAFGGREGAQDALGNAVGSFMQSGTGMAMMGAGYQRGGGFNMSGVGGSTTGALARAAGNATPEMLLEMTTRPQELQAKMLKDQPAMLAAMAQQIMSQTENLGRGSNVNKRTLFMNLLGQQTGASGAQLEGLMRQIEESPGALRSQQRTQARELGNQITSRALEEAAITPQIRRHVKGAFSGAGEGLSSIGAYWGDAASNRINEFRNRFYGLEDLQMGGKVDVDDITRVSRRAGDSGFLDDEALAKEQSSGPRGAMRQDMDSGRRAMAAANNQGRRERNSYRKFVRENDGKEITKGHHDAAEKIMREVEIDGGQGAVAKAKLAELNEATDPERKRQLMREYMNLATADQYDKMLTQSPGVIRAMENRIAEEHGLNPAGILIGGPGRKFKVTAEDEASLSSAMKDVEESMRLLKKGMKNEDIKTAAADPELQKYIDLMGTGTTSEINAQKEKLTGPSASIAEAMGQGVTRVGGSLGKIRDVEGDRAIQKRAMDAGGDLGRVLAGSLDSKAMAALGKLEGGDFGPDILAALGDIKLSQEQRDSFREKGVSETIMKVLDADSSGEGLEALVGKDKAKEMMEGGLTPEELGTARLSAMMGEGIGGRVTMGKNTRMRTSSEARSANELATQMDSIAKSSLALSHVVKELQKKQKG